MLASRSVPRAVKSGRPGRTPWILGSCLPGTLRRQCTRSVPGHSEACLATHASQALFLRRESGKLVPGAKRTGSGVVRFSDGGS